MIEFKEVDKPIDITQKIAEEFLFSIKKVEGEISQLTELLIQNGTLLNEVDLKLLKHESLFDLDNIGLPYANHSVRL